MDRNTKIIAVAGKGGVGKTSISAAFVRLLTETYPESRILAIDADPAVGLSTALGVEVKATLDDIRKGIVQSVEMGAQREAIELLSEARFRIFDTMVEQQKFSFLAIGRPETAGCYCKVNAYLKEVINLLSHDFDYVVIDGEAGIEQINRRVMEKVTHLVLLTKRTSICLYIPCSFTKFTSSSMKSLLALMIFSKFLTIKMNGALPAESAQAVKISA